MLYIIVNILIAILWYYSIVVQNVTIGGSCVKDMCHLSVIFVTIAYLATVISKSKAQLKKKKKKDTNGALYRPIDRSGLLKILLRGLSDEMAIKLKSSGSEGPIQLKSWGKLSRRKTQQVQGSRDRKSLAHVRLWQKPGCLQHRKKWGWEQREVEREGQECGFTWGVGGSCWCVLSWEMT